MHALYAVSHLQQKLLIPSPVDCSLIEIMTERLNAHTSDPSLFVFQNHVQHLLFKAFRGICLLASACSWRQAAMPQHFGHNRHQKYNLVCAGSLG